MNTLDPKDPLYLWKMVEQMKLLREAANAHLEAAARVLVPRG